MELSQIHGIMEIFPITKWMDDWGFYVLFNSILVISGQWADDNERLCAMEPCLQLRIFRLVGLGLRTDRSVGQRLTH